MNIKDILIKLKRNKNFKYYCKFRIYQIYFKYWFRFSDIRRCFYKELNIFKFSISCNNIKKILQQIRKNKKINYEFLVILKESFHKNCKFSFICFVPIKYTFEGNHHEINFQYNLAILKNNQTKKNVFKSVKINIW